MEENAPPARNPGAPKTYSLSMNFSWSGPGLPDKAGLIEFVRSLGRREITLIVALFVFVFLIEPIILYGFFSAKLAAQLNLHTDMIASSLAGRISAEVGAAVRDQLARQQFSDVTPLRATDPTSLVISPATQQSPKPSPPKP